MAIEDLEEIIDCIKEIRRGNIATIKETEEKAKRLLLNYKPEEDIKEAILYGEKKAFYDELPRIERGGFIYLTEAKMLAEKYGLGRELKEVVKKGELKQLDEYLEFISEGYINWLWEATKKAVKYNQGKRKLLKAIWECYKRRIKNPEKIR